MKRIKNILNLIWHAAPLEFLFIVFFSVITGVTSAFEILIWKYLIDAIAAALVQPNDSTVWHWMFLYLCFGIIGFCMIRIMAHVRWKYITKLKNKIQLRVLEKTSHIDFIRFYDSVVYDEISRIKTDGSMCLSDLIQCVTACIQHLITYVSVFMILFPYNKWIALVESACIIPILLVDLKLAEKLYQVNQKNLEPKRMEEKVSRLFYDYRTLQEIRLTKISSFMKDKVFEYQQLGYTRELKERKIQLKTELWLNSLYIFINCFLKFLATIALIHEAVTIGVITMFINAVDQIAMNLQNIVGSAAQIKTDMLYVDSLLDFLAQEEYLNGAFLLDRPIETIEFSHVYFKYPKCEDYILEDVSFTLKHGNIYLLSGANGAGKSTIIRLLVGLFRPERGCIFINGVDINSLNLLSLYDCMGIMLQEYNKYPFTIRENVTLDRTFDEARMHDVLAFVNLHDYVDRLAKKDMEILDNEQDEGIDVSLGQWQKLALARTLYGKKEMLILDEPTASLDAETTAKLYQYLQSHKGIVLLISHDEAAKQNWGTLLKIKEKHVFVETD